MSVNSSSGDIRVAQDKQLGIYQIKVIGILPDKTTASFIFAVNLIRRLL
jgi:hypothetical protein